jgi:hypothetical protein
VFVFRDLQGVPRTLVLESKTGGANLLQWPIEETDSLRGCKISQTDVKLDAGAIVEIKGAAGDQVSTKFRVEGPFPISFEWSRDTVSLGLGLGLRVYSHG